MNKRACIIAHFDKDNIVDEYVYYYLKELMSVAGKIIFVTVSDIDIEDINRLDLMGINIIKRDNIGYDFYSYKMGIKSLDLSLYDEVIICNDSVFGPLIPIKELFNKMDGVNCDFWGITESNLVAYHIQSYFIVFRKKLIDSLLFYKSWDNIEILEDKSEIIEKYEIGLSQLYIQNDFIGTACNKDNISHKTILIYILKLLKEAPFRIFNITKNPFFYINIIRKKQYNAPIHFWKDFLVKGNLFFLKKSLVTDKIYGNDNYKEIKTIFKENSKYNGYAISLIKNYMKRFRD